jgi:hypothetical protein
MDEKNMIWMVDKFRSRFCLTLSEIAFQIPFLIEVEYQVSGKTVQSTSLRKKVYYNRDMLLKHAASLTDGQIDRYIDDAVSLAIDQHLTTCGLTLVGDS